MKDNKNLDENMVSTLEKVSHSQETKKQTFKSPDLEKLREVRIDHRTTIYIAQDADPEEARIRYLKRVEAKENLRLPKKRSN